MDLSWVDTFLAVVETGSFRAAARRRYVSQAAVSQQIARLERELGVTLFTRHARGIVLSAAGSRFLPDAEHLVAVWRRSQAELGREQTRDRLVIAADWLTAETVTPWLCRQLLVHRPEADLVVRLIGAVPDDWDVALTAEISDLGGWPGSALFADPVVWVTAMGGGDLDQPPPDPGFLLHERRVLVPGDARYWTRIEERLRTQGPAVRQVAISQPSVIKRLVAEDVGTSFLPELLVRRETLEGRLLALPLPWLDDIRVRTHLIRRGASERPHAPDLGDLAEQLLRRRFPARTQAPRMDSASTSEKSRT
ncbi:MAG: LysR family transcriptional regulator [Clostridia bacterium]